MEQKQKEKDRKSCGGRNKNVLPLEIVSISHPRRSELEGAHPSAVATDALVAFSWGATSAVTALELLGFVLSEFPRAEPCRTDPCRTDPCRTEPRADDLSASAAAVVDPFAAAVAELLGVTACSLGFASAPSPPSPPSASAGLSSDASACTRFWCIMKPAAPIAPNTATPTTMSAIAHAERRFLLPDNNKQAHVIERPVQLN